MDGDHRVAMLESLAEGGVQGRYSLSNQVRSVSVELADDGDVISMEEFHPYGTTSWYSVDASKEYGIRDAAGAIIQEGSGELNAGVDPMFLLDTMNVDLGELDSAQVPEVGDADGERPQGRSGWAVTGWSGCGDSMLRSDCRMGCGSRGTLEV